MGADMSDETPEITPVATTGAPDSSPSGKDVPPDHLSVNPSNPFFNGELLRRGVGIRFKGVDRIDIEEYSISESWVRVQVGKTVDRKGQPLTIKINGPVEAWFEDLGEDAPVARKD
jgi:hypothetical protein